jgi:Mn2+/Fe2+ NRAMP family transporter
MVIQVSLLLLSPIFYGLHMFLMVVGAGCVPMGDWKKGMWANVIAGTTSVVMIVLTVMMVWNSLHGG